MATTNSNYEIKINKSTHRKLNILLGITGSVASIKLNELVNHLIDRLNVNICIIPTENSLHFIDDFDSLFNKTMPNLQQRLHFLTNRKNENEQLSNETKNEKDDAKVIFSFRDKDEWSSWTKRSDAVLHIELKKWADLFLIAPLDANTLAKLSNGLCDNLLTCVARAWDIDKIKQKPIVICPAMNTFMYKNPITARQLKILIDEFGYKIIDCIEKTLICGDSGIGAMANIDTIVNTISELVENL